MKYEIKYLDTEGKPVVSETTDLLSFCANHNVPLTGLMRDNRRSELNGLPLLRGFTGPYWHGRDVVRYTLLR
jgi:hypothetical protein